MQGPFLLLQANRKERNNEQNQDQKRRTGDAGVRDQGRDRGRDHGPQGEELRPHRRGGAEREGEA